MSLAIALVKKKEQFCVAPVCFRKGLKPLCKEELWF